MQKKIVSIVMAAGVVIGTLAPSNTAQLKADIRLSAKSITLEEGASQTLKVKGTAKKVTWSTTDRAVATVSKVGKVTAINAGNATIKAKVVKKTLKCKVKVTEKASEPLTKYWTAGSTVTKQFREYVEKVTDPNSPDFIPVTDRNVVFDMDGTLICETYFTYYDTMMFLKYVAEHPDVSDNVKAQAAIVKPGYKAGEELARAFAEAYGGMTLDEFYNYVVEFGKTQTVSFKNMRYIDCFYKPMVELVEYLYYNDFTIYVVSGTERTTTRAIIANSPIRDYVTMNHVIGTQFEVKVKGNENVTSNMDYKYVPGDQLVLTGRFVEKNLNAAKTLTIEREIGMKPVLAFGNSGSDTSMLNYTLDNNPYLSAAFMVVADDDVREWGKEDFAQKSADYAAQGYTSISMKNDFAEIYDEGIVPAESQI